MFYEGNYLFYTKSFWWLISFSIGENTGIKFVKLIVHKHTVLILIIFMYFIF